MTELSVRALARALDPVDPPVRLAGSATDSELDWYLTRFTTEAQREALHEAIRATTDTVGVIEHDECGLSQLHRWTPRQRRAGEHRSLRAMSARHGESSTRTRLLAYNTWLIDPPVGKHPLDRAARVPEIGRALDAGEFDVMALSEVFKKRDGDAIVEELSFDPDTERGPGKSGVEIGSGLQTITRKASCPIVSTAKMVYGNTGGLPDSLSRKGVLYTEIDLGPGKIDLFLTHMYAPGAEEEDQGLSEARRLQTIELGMFVHEHRKPGNVTIVAGDLNVDGRKNEYRVLLQTLYTRQRGRIRLQPRPSIVPMPERFPLIEMAYDFQLRLQDAWLTRGSSYGATASVPQYAEICRLDDDGYCQDHDMDGTSTPPEDREPGYRLDYIFVEEPRDEHSFNLDLTRVRRRPFWRGGEFKDEFTHTRPAELSDLVPGGDLFEGLIPEGGVFGIDPEAILAAEVPPIEIPNYLSDHLGLEVTLIASPGSGA